jgi:hypothetical protein
MIGIPGGARSKLWRVFSQRNDVYVNTLGVGGVEKLSFHESGICRKAFTREHATPETSSDRATSKWRRAPTPPAGANLASFVFEVGVPTDYLSTAIEPPSKEVTWIAPAPPGLARGFIMYFTRESEETVRAGIGNNGTLLSYTKLPMGDSASLPSVLSHAHHVSARGWCRMARG